MNRALLLAVCLALAASLLPATVLAQSQPPAIQTAPEPGKSPKPGDTVFVTERNGVQTKGRVVRVSPQELALLVGGAERVIPRNSIVRIEKSDPLWNGIVIGALPGALAGAAGAGASCSPHCGRDVPRGALFFGAVGAAVGALVDANVHGYTIVEGQPLPAPNAIETPVRVASVNDIALRVRGHDTITVTTTGGETITGRFGQVSTMFLIVTVDGKPRNIPSSDVRRVTRLGNYAHTGALWGGLLGGAMGVAAVSTCHGNGCDGPLDPMITGLAGAFWGSMIGRAIPRHSVIYDSGASPIVHVMPMMAPGRFGVAVSVTF